MHGWMRDWDKTLQLSDDRCMWVAIPPIERGERSDEQKDRLSDQNLSSGAESGGDTRWGADCQMRTNARFELEPIPAHRFVCSYIRGYM